jgi:hypothetical protein
MEQSILNVAREFAAEITRLETLKPGTQATISLSILARSKYDNDQSPKLTLSCHFYDGNNFSTVGAASLGSMMDEVRRRLSFADREHFQIEAAQRALTGIEHQPVEGESWDSSHVPL